MSNNKKTILIYANDHKLIKTYCSLNEVHIADFISELLRDTTNQKYKNVAYMQQESTIKVSGQHDN